MAAVVVRAGLKHSAKVAATATSFRFLRNGKRALWNVESNVANVLSGATNGTKPAPFDAGADGRKTQGEHERALSLSNSNRGRRRERRPRAQILRPESAGFPQNLERLAVAVSLLPRPPACQIVFLDKQKPAPFDAGWFPGLFTFVHTAHLTSSDLFQEAADRLGQSLPPTSQKGGVGRRRHVPIWGSSTTGNFAAHSEGKHAGNLG